MKELEPEASRRLERYLDQVRAALRGARTVDAGEVESDVAAHIRSELAAQPGPVSVSVLDAVLERLGSPARWVPAEELSPWRRLVARLHSGPEDWRLAYLALASFVLALLAAPGGLGPMAAALLAASYLSARATLTALDENAEELGARRWLVHPPLIAVGGLLLFALLSLPLFAAFGIAHEVVELEAARPRFPGSVVKHAAGLERIADARNPLDTVVFALRSAHVLLFVLGSWWIVLGLAALRWPARMRAVFRPLLDGLRHGHARLLLAIAGLLLGLALVAYLANA